MGGAPPVSPTTEQPISRHQAVAEPLLVRAGGGRLDAETRFATMAAAHARLAVSYLLSPPAEDAVIDLDDE